MKHLKNKKLIAIIMAVAFATATTGCVKVKPVIIPDCTLPPLSTPIPIPTIEPTPTMTAEPTSTAAPAVPSIVYDAYGNPVLTSDHFEQFIEFRNIQVYEQEDDTFMDAIAVNNYSETLVCAAQIAFFDDVGLVADAKLQTRDGQYVLVLEPGETTVFAQIDTDMSVTALEFAISFDESFGVQPKQ